MVKKNYMGYIVLVIVVIILFSLRTSEVDNVTEVTREQYARESGLIFDGYKDPWYIRLHSISSERAVGENLQITVDVGSDASKTGTKYVQCSILDATEHNWLTSVTRAGFSRETVVYKPSSEYNCVADEPYTKTTQLLLEPFGEEKIKFIIQIPNYPEGHSYMVFCDMFEQCASSGDPLSSGSFAKSIIIDEGPDCGSRTFKKKCFNHDIWYYDECDEITTMADACGKGFKCDDETYGPDNLRCVNKREQTQCDDECYNTNSILCIDSQSYHKCKIDDEGCYKIDNARYTLNPTFESCQNDMIQERRLIEQDLSPPPLSERKTLWEWIQTFF